MPPRFLIACIVVSTLVACSSNSGGPTATSDTGTGDSAAPIDSHASETDDASADMVFVTAPVHFSGGGIADGTLTCPNDRSFVRRSDAFLTLHEDDAAPGTHSFFVDLTVPDVPPTIGKTYHMVDLKNPDSGFMGGGNEYHARAMNADAGTPAMGDMTLTFSTATSGTLDLTMASTSDAASPLAVHLTFAP